MKGNESDSCLTQDSWDVRKALYTSLCGSLREWRVMFLTYYYIIFILCLFPNILYFHIFFVILLSTFLLHFLAYFPREGYPTPLTLVSLPLPAFPCLPSFLRST